ncbi:MAG: PadR family transcriptional regulator [Candidatus Thorarchaeota archaeon]|jgi:DNA-binding PadR family transcriptional regulator
MTQTKSNPREPDLLPSTYLAVLSLIGAGAKYGYEINQILEQRGYRNWVDIKFSSIYKALKELETKNLIKGQKSDEKMQPSKKTYSITRKGSRLLRNQIVQCLVDPPKANSLFDLGMSAIFQLTKEEAVESLKKRLVNLEGQIHFLGINAEAIKNLEKIREVDPDRIVGGVKASEVPSDAHLGVVLALFERPYVRLNCERKWLEDLVLKIEKDEAGFLFRKSSR